MLFFLSILWFQLPSDHGEYEGSQEYEFGEVEFVGIGSEYAKKTQKVCLHV